MHAARTHLLQAYGAIRRYPRDPRWGRIDGNPEARRAMELARLNLRMARDHLRRAAAIAAAIGDSPAHDGQADSDSRPSSLLARLCRGRAPSMRRGRGGGAPPAWDCCPACMEQGRRRTARPPTPFAPGRRSGLRILGERRR